MATVNQYFNIGACTSARWVDENHFVFLSTKSGVNQIWEKDLQTGKEEQKTFFNERVWSLYVNQKNILFTMDFGGNEQEQIYVLEGSEARNLTNNNSARYQLGGMKPDGETVVYACNARNPKNFDLCQLNIKTGEQEIILENTDSYNTPAALSPDGKYLLYNKLKAQSDNCLWMLDIENKTAKNIDANAEYAQYTSPTWKHDNSGFYFLTDKNSEYKYLAYYNLKEDSITKIYEENWDIEDIELSSDDKYLAIKINRNGYSDLEILNTHTNCFENTPSFPKSVMAYYGMSWSSETHRLLLTLTSGQRPSDIWMLDIDKDKVERITFTDTGEINKDELVEPQLSSFKSFDGVEVPYWIYKGRNSKNSKSVVIEVHGGPEAQERPMFSPLIQYLVSEGLTVVAPNVRGSTGYGKKYHHLDDIEKRLDSVHDAACLAEHLVKENIADADKIAVMGASYGGYMTLSCVTRYPNLWAAGIDTVGMSNLETFLENTADYRRSHRESEYGSLKEHREILRNVSPIHHVDDIVAPLMVVHGANDPRVPVGEAEQIVKSLKDRNIPVEYLLYTDEGHGIAKRKNQFDCYPKVAAFLKKHLKVE